MEILVSTRGSTIAMKIAVINDSLELNSLMKLVSGKSVGVKKVTILITGLMIPILFMKMVPYDTFVI